MDLARAQRRFGFAANGDAGASARRTGIGQAFPLGGFRASYTIIEPTSPWSAPVLLCLFVTAWAAALRGYHLGMPPAWHDQSFVPALGRAGGWGAASGGPPLYAVIYGTWIEVLRAFGMAPGTVGVRLPSVMIGALTVPFFFVMFRGFGERVALIGATFLATSPAHLTFSRIAGPDALSVFLLVAAVGCTTRLLERIEVYCENEGHPSNLWRDGTFRALAAGYAAGAILLGYADTAGFAVVLLATALVFVNLASGRLPIATTVRIWTGLNLAIAVALLPDLWLVLNHAGAAPDWASHIGAHATFARVLLTLIDAAAPPGADVPSFMVLAGMMIAETLLVVGCYQVPSGGARRAGILIGFLIALALVFTCGAWPPVLLAAAPSLFALPFFALLAGFALEMPFLSRNAHAGVVFTLLLIGIAMRMS